MVNSKKDGNPNGLPSLIYYYSADVANGEGCVYTRAANSLSNIYYPLLLS